MLSFDPSFYGLDEAEWRATREYINRRGRPEVVPLDTSENPDEEYIGMVSQQVQGLLAQARLTLQYLSSFLDTGAWEMALQRIQDELQQRMEDGPERSGVPSIWGAD